METKKTKIDSEKLFQVFCIYLLALVASFVAGESFAPKKANAHIEAVDAPLKTSQE